MAKEPSTGEDEPELIIHELRQLLDIFPGRNGSGDGS